MDGSFGHEAFADAASDAAGETARQLAELRARLKRRMERRTRQAHAVGMMDGILGQLRPGDVAIDCGANVGAITERIAATGATVYASEPDPVAFAELSARCGGRPGVHLIPAAVGDAPGTATLRRSHRFDDDPLAGTVGSTVVPGARAGALSDAADAVEVPVVDLPAILDDLLAGRAPEGVPAPAAPVPPGGKLALLKMDVEGAELRLVNALDAAGTLARIRCTVVETHERKFPALRRDFARLRERMARAYPPSQVYLDWI